VESTDECDGADEGGEGVFRGPDMVNFMLYYNQPEEEEVGCRVDAKRPKQSSEK